MKRCVECQEVLSHPVQVPLCAECRQKMLIYKIEKENEKESEEVK